MDFAIRLSCILALFFCLASTGNAAPDDQVRQKLQDLLRRSEQTNDPNALGGIAYETVQIYKKYRGLGESDTATETELNTKVHELESVEGMPVQGTKKGQYFTIYIPPSVDKRKTQIIIQNIIKYLLGHKFRVFRGKKPKNQKEISK